MVGKLATLFIVPFFGTCLGSLGVFFLKKEIPDRLNKFILGFASGVMLAALVWALLVPAIEDGGYFKSSLGFLFGIIVLFLLDMLIPHLHVVSKQKDGRNSTLSNVILLVLAISLHNLPEGLAVGTGAGAYVAPEANITFYTVFVLALGLAIQNIPEGFIVSMPLYIEGKRSKLVAFLLGCLSGLVEPIGALCAYFLVKNLDTKLPYFLSFAAGAMFYVVIEELIPEGSRGEHSEFNVIGASIGFILILLLNGIFS